MKALLDLVQRHKAGAAVGIYSVCSAHPLVIEAALRVGLAGEGPVLIEATSNQVNQFGGYTGKRPGEFRRYVEAIADGLGFPRQRLLLGGDHLGPNCWQAEPAEQAMAKAAVMVDQYVTAGFRKIHLDCSMSCAGDPLPLPDSIVAGRAATLCAVAERAWSKAGGEAPVYVIGTEVPVPGGAKDELHALSVTTVLAARTTIDVHRDAFAEAGLRPVWPRVIALVVQPGVEFDNHNVLDYAAPAAAKLREFIESEPGMVYEAHSTDYQTPASLKAMVRDHFAALKVGPAATFALRETLWALADIEREWLGPGAGSDFKQVVLGAMRSQPAHWQSYYRDVATQEFDLQFSLSDRVRYYWPVPEIAAAQSAMLANLQRSPIPLPLLSQYLPRQYEAIRDGRLAGTPSAILDEGVARVLRQYESACSGIEIGAGYTPCP
jgi:D-tagatose-1,6-bisphosphate aldolase subunit GatZ/KbaZ